MQHLTALCSAYLFHCPALILALLSLSCPHCSIILQAENSGDVCIELGPHQHRQSAPHAAAQLASSFPDDEEDWQAQNSRQDGSTASHHHQCHPSPDKPPNEQQQEQLQGEAKDEQCKQTASHTQPSRHQVQKQEDGRQQQRPRLSAPALFDASDQGFLWKVCLLRPWLHLPVNERLMDAPLCGLNMMWGLHGMQCWCDVVPPDRLMMHCWVSLLPEQRMSLLRQLVCCLLVDCFVQVKGKGAEVSGEVSAEKRVLECKNVLKCLRPGCAVPPAVPPT